MRFNSKKITSFINSKIFYFVDLILIKTKNNEYTIFTEENRLISLICNLDTAPSSRYAIINAASNGASIFPIVTKIIRPNAKRMTNNEACGSVK